MTTNTLNTRILLRSDTTANWNNSTIVLLNGEIGIEFLDSGESKAKAGNGTDIWTDLPYISLTPNEINALLTALNASAHTHSNKSILDEMTASFTTALKTKLDGIANSADNVEFTQSLKSGTKVGTISINGTGIDLYAPSVYTHPNSGIQAGTYRSVTVNAQGHVTAGTNPTTLAGYGITDAVKNTEKGAANGVATLGSDGRVPSSQLPSYVDDVIEGYLSGGKFYKETAHTTELSGESEKIYVDLTSNKTYRWTGTAFTVISETIALGETSSSAYRGDRGKIAYDHSQSAHAPSNAETNQNAFSNVIVGSTTVAAGSKTDTLNLTAGSNVTITPDATNKKITIVAKDTITRVKGNSESSYRSGDVNITPENIGLGNVNNTADSAKNVLSATKLTTARTIALSGAATGTATSFNGSANISIPVTSLNAINLTLSSDDTLILNGGGAS